MLYSDALFTYPCCVLPLLVIPRRTSWWRSRLLKISSIVAKRDWKGGRDGGREGGREREREGGKEGERGRDGEREGRMKRICNHFIDSLVTHQP